MVQVKKKMSTEDFLKNNRGINDGQDLPADFMRSLYNRIVSNEIKVSAAHSCHVCAPGVCGRGLATCLIMYI